MRVQPICCAGQCGMLVPLTVNGAYGGHDGMTNVFFNVATSATCGIRVQDVLDSNLEGLRYRDDPLQLNPNAESMRLKIELAGYEPFVRKMNTPSADYTMERLVRGVCRQIAAFTNEAQINGNPGFAGLMFGQGQAGGIDVNQLVLISIKRITTGTWVPVIRLVNSNGA